MDMLGIVIMSNRINMVSGMGISQKRAELVDDRSQNWKEDARDHIE